MDFQNQQSIISDYLKRKLCSLRIVSDILTWYFSLAIFSKDTRNQARSQAARPPHPEPVSVDVAQAIHTLLFSSEQTLNPKVTHYPEILQRERMGTVHGPEGSATENLVSQVQNPKKIEEKPIEIKNLTDVKIVVTRNQSFTTLLPPVVQLPAPKGKCVLPVCSDVSWCY